MEGRLRHKGAVRGVARKKWALLALPLIGLLGSPLPAQTLGTLVGIVVDERNGQPMRGARVVVEGHAAKAQTDLEGTFSLPLPEGTYQVSFTASGYQPESLSEVVIQAGRVNNIGVVLRSAAATTAPSAGDAATPRVRESVAVTAEATQATEAALLVERKGAEEISDAIGRQEISKGAATDTAGVMQRVTGISLVDDKYVYVRGLGERYSNTTLNGSILPSTEPEKRVVPLDLFSANLLDKVTVSKSYTPDKPGEFAAGFVELETLDFPARPTLAFTAGGSYEPNTTGENFSSYAGGLSWSGRGGQGLPSSFPDEKVSRGGVFGGGLTREELEAIGESIGGSWEPSSDTAPVNGSYSLTAGNTFGPIGVVLSGSYNNSFDFTQERQDFYQLGQGGELEAGTGYDFDISEETVRRGLVGSFSVRVNDNHRLRLRSLYTDYGTSEARFFEGFNRDAFANFRDSRLRYQNESILTGQLSGEHFLQILSPSGSLLEWKGSLARGENEENLREVLYREITAGEYILADESQSGFLLFNDLTDDIVEGGVNWTTFLVGSKNTGSVKLGGWYSGRERDFRSRRFRFVPGVGFRVNRSLPPEQLFTPENIGPGGFEISEETRPTDRYTGEHDILAGFAMGDATLGRWRFVGGLRIERSEQNVVTFDPFIPGASAIQTANEDTDYLPAISVVYGLGPTTNLRAAFSATVNRPEFRELAPFEFTDVVGGRAVVGNPELTRALIRSYDLRWEWFPSSGEVIAASVFYKDIDDPIERIIQATEQLRTSYTNANAAENFGLELEFRRNLAALAQALRAWTLIANYTYVDSSVDIGERELSIVTSLERPLAGQADHIGNATVEFAPPTWGTVVRLLYNYSGDRISDVGALGAPDIIEQARHTLDVVWLQEIPFVRGLRLKLYGENLLDEERLFTQQGLPQRRYEPGRKYGFNLAYSVF